MDEDDLFDDELEIELRSRDEIAARMVILAALVRRATLERSPEFDSATDTAQGDRFDLATALREEPLAANVAADELRIVSTPVGELDADDAMAASWRVEALAALASLVLPGFPLSAPWRQTDARTLLAAIPDPWDDLGAFAASLALPTDEDAAVERERAELWAWRAAVEIDLAVLSGRALAQLHDIIAETATEAATAGLLRVVDRDLAVDSLPFVAIDAETKAIIAGIAIERLHAFNWLCGFGDSWASVPMET